MSARARMLTRFLAAMVAFGVLLTVAFESYFQQHQCTVSASYYAHNLALAKTVTSTLIANSIPFW